MEGEPKTPLSHKRRSGSENRQKRQRITLRLTAEEAELIRAAANADGLTVGSYIRTALLAAPKTRTRRRTLADVAVLAKLIGELNRIGGNINQVVRRVNFGETPIAAEFHQALAGHREIIAAIRAAMGLAGR